MYIKLLSQINDFINSTDKEIILIAIDGPCTSGKSYFSQYLKDNIDCNVFHMDDFFLPFELKTKQRLEKAGENVHHERFKTEVLDKILLKQNFIYNIYSCKEGGFYPSDVQNFKRVNIVEGVYSLNNNIKDFYDLKIFMDVNSQKQQQRLLKRSPNMYDKFMDMWVPMENKYFTQYKVKENCNIVFDTSDLF